MYRNVETIDVRPVRSDPLGWLEGALELFLDGVHISNAINFIRYDDAGFAVIACTGCGQLECGDGPWFSLRKHDDRVVIVAASTKLRDVDRASSCSPAAFMTGRAVPALNEAQYARLRSIAPSLPGWKRLPPLSALDVLVLHQLRAPGQFFGEVFRRAAVQVDLALAASDGDVADHLRVLRDLVSAVEAGREVPVFDAPDRVIDVYLDLPSFPSWPCLAYRDGVPALPFPRSERAD